MVYHGDSMEFCVCLPTWHENSIECFTWNLMESPWKISRFPMEFHGYQTGTFYSAGSPNNLIRLIREAV